jgi:hypothetical protein
MPVLTTFGGAAARTFGRAIDLQPPIFPAGTVVMYDGHPSSDPLPANWSYLAEAEGKLLLGTETEGEINTTDPSAGQISITGNTVGSAVAGDHSRLVGSGFFYRQGSAPYGSGLFSAYASTGGNHRHLWTTQTLIATDNDLPPYVETPLVYNTIEQQQLPAKSLVFRQTQPSSVNYQEFVPPSTSRFAWRGSASRNPIGYDQNLTSVITKALGTSASGGTHDHGPDLVTRSSGSFTYSTFGYNTSSGSITHTHPQTVTYSMRVRGKFLKTWKSLFRENLQNGMIVMYIGSLSDLPAGWRVCDGLFNTPDMRGYYLSSATVASTNHNYVTDTTTILTVQSTSLDSVTWSHSHQGSSFSSTGRHTSYHSTGQAPHDHSVTTTKTTVIDYKPIAFRLAFIQYKGL